MLDFIKRRVLRTDAAPWTVLAVMCLAVFLINTSTLVVNIALPQISGQLGASSGDLVWIVDAFNLSFATLVLAAGSLSDRFGRRPALIGGLALFAAASLAGAWSGSPAVLIALRAVAGVGAAVIFPVTLSIIVTVFPGRAQRSKAIGIWGAASGAGVGIGPLVGGLLIQHFWWGSILLFTAAVAFVALVASLRYAPDSRDPSTPPLDRLGLLLSTAGVGVLVYSIIQAPEHGWSSTETLAGFAIAAVILIAFVAWERVCEHPMLDVTLFSNLRFTAASAAVTIAFFATFGFTFLIVQYFQLLHDYGPFETGLRVLPVALCTAPSSLYGVKLALRYGNKIVVATGLLSFAIAFAWISHIGAETSYLVIVGQMLFLGVGLGLSTAPATEAIMGVVPAHKAGVGSAINDATRELGGTLGVAIIGSVAYSIYRDHFAGHQLSTATLGHVQNSIDGALQFAGQLQMHGNTAGAAHVSTLAKSGFLDGLQTGCWVAAGVCLAGAALVLSFLPAHPLQTRVLGDPIATDALQPATT